jgi:hypothetical protein
MKKLLVFTVLLISFNAFSYSTTQLVAYTLAETIYVTAITGATIEVSSNITSSTEQRKEAVKIQNEVQNYYQSGELSPFLAAKLEVVAKIDASLSEEEALDALLESTLIILNK